MSDTPQQPPGYYYAQGDPPNTQRYWDGSRWVGGPQPVAPPGGVGSGAESSLAEGGTRILARLIDLVIWIVISLVSALVIGGGAATVGGTDVTARQAAAGLVGGLVIVAYEVFMVVNGGQTIGKRVMKTKVVTEDGDVPDLVTALKRISPYLVMVVLGTVPFLGAIVSLAVLIIGLVSVVTIFSDDRNQAIWDKIAKTLVVRAG